MQNIALFMGGGVASYINMIMISELDSEIKEIIPRTYNVKSFRLNSNNGVSFKAGQFLIVTINRNLTKPLSISSSPTEKGYIEFTKKITNSEFSTALDSLRAGDIVKIKYPYGNFTFSGEYSKIAFLSGGIGITPVRSICKYVVDKKLNTDVVLLYGNRTDKDIVFKEDFSKMQGVKVVHILSEADSGWTGRTEHINSQIIKEEISDYLERKFFICGPPGMVESMKKILREELTLLNENIITENFTGY